MAKDQGMTVLARSPLRNGQLTVKYLSENSNAEKDARFNLDVGKNLFPTDEAQLQTIREIVAIAKELGVSAAQVALVWLRYRAVPVIPIIGARKFAQLVDNMQSLALNLSHEHVQRLDQSSTMPLGFPHAS